MLAPMCLANPSKAWRLAMLTTVTSVAGGLFGYMIGAFAFDIIEPTLKTSSYWVHFQTAQSWFKDYGFWAIFVAGFSPIPYKVFTIAAGALSMAILPFTIASIIGRGSRFFLVAGFMKWGGKRMEEQLHKYIDAIGWVTVGLVVLALLLLK